MSAPAVVIELVERFQSQRESYRAGGYNETQLRREFLDPLFEALGWDVHNRRGYAEAYKEVIHEDAIKIGGRTKAPDYCFRAGGSVRSFFVEAKKPSVDIREAVSPAYQLRRYAWSARLPVSILTDFEEWAVYDCRIRPAPTDKASTARIIYRTCDEYLDHWDELFDLFSPEAIRRGSLEKLVASKKIKKGTAEVDAAFLDEIESWRDELARNIALRNPGISTRDLNFAVQTTIDRLVFLRICEDRGIEPYGRLQDLANAPNIYRRLGEVFQRADERYNSGLFHFNAEHQRSEPPDELTLGLAIDDRPLKEILKKLYYPESPYEFSVLPAEILGQVYEQFLGKVIRLTKGGQAKVEEKPEVRKAGGVYYTPAYIVEYIVKNTVGRLLGGAEGDCKLQIANCKLQIGEEDQSPKAQSPTPNPQPLSPKDASRLRILDPACGSGSFLIGAYQYLLDWHRDWYVAHDAERHARGRNPVLYRGPGGQWRLTTPEKKRILLANIYGVDIDPQAVEVTKLSLLLKVLEGESEETIASQLRLFHERALPDLAGNIKCGNSLIGPDFYEGRQMNLLDDEERYRINVFEWETEFPAIAKAGGFDAVIGNPPWGADFSEPERDYLRKKYSRVVARMIDSYIYFLDRALRAAKPDAPVAFIIPSTILNQSDAQPVRRLLLDRGVSALINLGQGVFGSKVLNTSTILISRQAEAEDDCVVDDLTVTPLEDRAERLSTCVRLPRRDWESVVRADPQLTFFAGGTANTALLLRLRNAHVPLSSVVDGAIQRGVSPDVVAAHVVTQSDVDEFKLERDILRPSVSGLRIKRYRPWCCDQFIIYTGRDTQLSRFPHVAEYLKRFKQENTCKEVVQGKHPWWSLHRARDPAIFAPPKIIGLTTSKTIELIYDESTGACVTDAMYVFRLAADHDPWTLMGILQSRLFLFLYRVANQGESRVIPQVKASKLYDLPYPSGCLRHDRMQVLTKTMVELYGKMERTRNDHERTVLQRQIAATDGQIDRLVYELYGLTNAEIAIVEGTT